jgi:rSAM/selenodomain-associated transferase 1
METVSLILFFVKAPLRGKVKTRLAATLGEDAALVLHRSFALDLLSTVDSTGMAVQVFYTPSNARDSVADWLGRGRRYTPQEGPDLGSRMENAFRTAFAAGAERAVLVGSDLPDLPGEVFAEAFQALGDNDAVIGPARDGGYYLIGFRRDTFLPGIFPAMAWGTDGVFRETLKRFDAANYRVSLLREWRDMDTADDLAGLRERARGLPFERSRTVACIDRLCGRM